FINKVAKRKSAKTQDRPGVTRGRQWVNIDKGLELLDTPGILWPKFEDERTGLNLAFTGAVRDAVMDSETLAIYLMDVLKRVAPTTLTERYKLDDIAHSGLELLEAAAKKRGFLIAGGEVDLERMSIILLDEFRGGKLGKITLEFPPNEAAI
ncbi:MAG: GTPase, partial [Evtepia sp.]